LKFCGFSVGTPSGKVFSTLDGSFESGGINLVIGRSGVGKTSLLLSIAGILPHIGGEIFLDEKPWIPAGNYCLSFQEPENIFFCTTVGEEICYAGRKNGDNDFRIVERAKSWLKRWNLLPEIFWNRNPFKLSGGEKRRLALAISTFQPTELILLDEPFVYIDWEGKKRLLDILAEIAKERIVIVAANDPFECLRFCRLLLFLKPDCEGRFQTPQEFLRKSLEDPEFFPLPAWYSRIFGKNVSNLTLPPFPDFESVKEFFSKRDAEKRKNA